MFARTVRMQLKPNSVAEFAQTIKKDIIPWLCKQPGLQNKMKFVVLGGTEAVAISVWDQQEHVEAYARGTYPQVPQAVTKVVEGTPQVSTYEVVNSTFHPIAASGAICSGQVVCVRWERPQPSLLWSSKVTWKYLEDPVLPTAWLCLCALSCSRRGGFTSAGIVQSRQRQEGFMVCKTLVTSRDQPIELQMNFPRELPQNFPSPTFAEAHKVAMSRWLRWENAP